MYFFTLSIDLFNNVEYLYATFTDYEKAANYLLVFFEHGAFFPRTEKSLSKYQLG